MSSCLRNRLFLEYRPYKANPRTATRRVYTAYPCSNWHILAPGTAELKQLDPGISLSSFDGNQNGRRRTFELSKHLTSDIGFRMRSEARCVLPRASSFVSSARVRSSQRLLVNATICSAQFKRRLPPWLSCVRLFLPLPRSIGAAPQ